jgi:hypothetical protein
MSISADPRTNHLIVVAPQQLFEEVRLLVETLDYATAESNTAMKVVTLKRNNAASVQKALQAIGGEKVQTASRSGDSGSSSRSGGGDSSDLEAMRRRMEFFNSLRGGSSSGGSSFWGSRDGGSSSGFDRSRYYGGSGSSWGSSRSSGSSRDSGSSRGRD